MYRLEGKRVFVAGHGGMVGGALVRRLANEQCQILIAGRDVVDLRDQAATHAYLASERPDVVLLAAAKVGGILANDSFPADFLYDNLLIEANLIHAAHLAGVEKLLFLGSSCIYPKLAAQPIVEEALLTGPLEPTNEWYAIAKIAGIKLVQAYRQQHGRDFIAAMPTNLYGPGDNFDLLTSHVMPALIRKVYEAKLAGSRTIEIWGSGEPRREFLHVDDCADACIFLIKHYSDGLHINVGSGTDISINDLARKIMTVAGLEAEIIQDRSKPDGTPRKLMSAERLKKMGWRHAIDLDVGIAAVYGTFAGRCADR